MSNIYTPAYWFLQCAKQRNTTYSKLNNPSGTFSQSCDLHQAMFSALVGHKAEFVRLLLENGLCIIRFLKRKDTLCALYKHLPRCLFLHKLAKRAHGRKNISLSHVATEVRHLLGRFTRPLYCPAPPPHKIEISADDKTFIVSLNEAIECYTTHYIPHLLFFYSHTFSLQLLSCNN